MAPILAPAAILVVWTLVMLVWLARTRFPAMQQAGLNIPDLPPGGRGQDLQGVLPDTINWKAHNYAHLTEQPTIFYPTVMILALMGYNLIDVVFAWGYVAIRIAHSLWQAQVNTIPIRLKLFQASTLCLVVLALHALYVVFTNL